MIIGNFPLGLANEPELVRVDIGGTLVDYFHLFYYVTLEAGFLTWKLWQDDSYHVMVCKNTPAIWQFSEPVTVAPEFERIIPMEGMITDGLTEVYIFDHAGGFRPVE